jgi:hypothetical protein
MSMTTAGTTIVLDASGARRRLPELANLGLLRQRNQRIVVAIDGYSDCTLACPAADATRLAVFEMANSIAAAPARVTGRVQQVQKE